MGLGLVENPGEQHHEVVLLARPRLLPCRQDAGRLRP